MAGASGTSFRIFAPRATSVSLFLFTDHLDERGERHPMERDADGVWECSLPGKYTGRCYGYRIEGPEPSSRRPGEMFNPSVLVADPYSHAVVTRNTWRMPARSLITDTAYRWKHPAPRLPEDRNRLVVYEAHVRDMTAHPSAQTPAPGTYRAFAAPGARGGLSHLRSLGIDAVELLPVMKFGTMEIPFGDASARTDSGRVNTWNPYARNHWGYMTGFFFAPETYYGSDGTMEPGAFNGTDGRAVTELKELIDALHGEGIAVILDVVYNHTSHYDFNPLKYADKHYYYRCDDSGNFIEESGCGNDFDTGRPMARRLVVDSIRHWLKEYRVDGFRFDLAAMIDPETCARITEAARGINPGVLLVAEPWGGNRHHPAWFDELGWASWNDRYRDLVRGQNPFDRRGFIFGGGADAPDGGNGEHLRASLDCVLTGTLRPEGGLFSRSEHGVNYIESHDGYTLGDFIRLATGEITPDGRYRPGDPGLRLSDTQMSLNRFAAFVLLTSVGPVMIHEGQEFARSKVIAETSIPDPDAGKIDHNSYNKDNATNHLDYAERDRNAALVEYYRGLIGLRRRHPALCTPGAAGTVEFPDGRAAFAVRRIAFRAGDSPAMEYIVLLNADRGNGAGFALPGAGWRVLADSATVYPGGKGPAAGKKVMLPPSSGAVLGRKV